MSVFLLIGVAAIAAALTYLAVTLSRQQVGSPQHLNRLSQENARLRELLVEYLSENKLARINNDELVDRTRRELNRPRKMLER